MSLTDWIVLAVIAEEPRHGFSVARELAPDAPIGQVWTVRRPLVYRALEYLVADGSIEASRTEPGAQGPHRTVYRATRAGRARLTRWLDEPVDHPRDVRAELLAKFVLRARRGDALAPLAQRQLELFAPVTDGLTRAARQANGADRVVARWRIESTRAIARTLDAVVADEARGALDGAAVASLHASGAGADAED
jgi:DNA-binding PadR family transcriptional regulator